MTLYRARGQLDHKYYFEESRNHVRIHITSNEQERKYVTRSRVISFATGGWQKFKQKFNWRYTGYIGYKTVSRVGILSYHIAKHRFSLAWISTNSFPRVFARTKHTEANVLPLTAPSEVLVNRDSRESLWGGLFTKFVRRERFRKGNDGWMLSQRLYYLPYTIPNIVGFFCNSMAE